MFLQLKSVPPPFYKRVSPGEHVGLYVSPGENQTAPAAASVSLNEIQHIADQLKWPHNDTTPVVRMLEVPVEPFVYTGKTNAQTVESLCVHEWPPKVSFQPYTQLRSVEVRISFNEKQMQMDFDLLPQSVTRLTLVVKAQHPCKLVLSASAERVFEGVMIDASERTDKTPLKLSGTLFTLASVASLSLHNSVFEDSNDAVLRVKQLEWRSDRDSTSHACVHHALAHSTALNSIFVGGGSHRWTASAETSASPVSSDIKGYMDHKRSTAKVNVAVASTPAPALGIMDTIDLQHSEWASHGFVISKLYRRRLATVVKLNLAQSRAISHDALMDFATHLFANDNLTYALIKVDSEYELYVRVLFGALALYRASAKNVANKAPRQLTLEMPRNEVEPSVGSEYLSLLGQWLVTPGPVSFIAPVSQSPEAAAKPMQKESDKIRSELKAIHNKLMNNTQLKFTVQKANARSITVICKSTGGAVTFVV